PRCVYSLDVLAFVVSFSICSRVRAHFSSFPTRRSSDLVELVVTCLLAGGHVLLEDVPGTGKTTLARSIAAAVERASVVLPVPGTDRKSTRLNSSHVKISYAVFCLKKKIT